MEGGLVEKGGCVCAVEAVECVRAYRGMGWKRGLGLTSRKQGDEWLADR